MDLEIFTLPVLEDNYNFVLRDARTGDVAVVDPSEAEPVAAFLHDRGWRLDTILNTHHHGDHVGGNAELKRRYGCQILGPAYDRDRIPEIDVAVAAGETVRVGGQLGQVLYVPGHTRGHIAFWFAANDALFIGDTLFAMGCGRLFEGTPEQMQASLAQLDSLPDRTRVYCAHEYTLKNADFAVSVEPQNADLRARREREREKRQKNLPTVPTTLAEERMTNPFLRTDSPSLRAHLGLTTTTPAEVFAHLRRLRNGF